MVGKADPPGQARREQCRDTRVTRAQKRVGHKVWRVWWGGTVDSAATKKARRKLHVNGPLKRGCRVRIREHRNSTELEFDSGLKYDAVNAWLQRVTESSSFQIRGCERSPGDKRAQPSPQQKDKGPSPVCNAGPAPAEEEPAGASAASSSANLGESSAAGDQGDALAVAGRPASPGDRSDEVLRRRAKALSFLALKATNFVSFGVHRKENKAPGASPKGLGELLGKGTCGKVYRSRHREEDVAIKFMRHSDPCVWLTEVACLFCGAPSRAHRAAPRRDLRAGFLRARLPALRDELGQDDW